MVVPSSEQLDRQTPSGRVTLVKYSATFDDLVTTNENANRMSTGPGGAAPETIGQRLKRLRLEQGLSQRELASPGVSYAYISRIEAGTRQPSVKALRRLGAKLGVSAEYLETGSVLDPAERRELRLADLELAIRLGESEGVEERLRELVDEAVAAGDSACTLRGRVALASIALEAGAFSQTVDLLEAALEDEPFAPADRIDIYCGARPGVRRRRPPRTGGRAVRALSRRGRVLGRRCGDLGAVRDAPQLRAQRRRGSRPRGAGRPGSARPRAGDRGSVHARPALLVDRAARAPGGTRVRRAHERAQGDRAAPGDGRLVPPRPRARPRGGHHALARRRRRLRAASRPRRPASRGASVHAGRRRDQDPPLARGTPPRERDRGGRARPGDARLSSATNRRRTRAWPSRRSGTDWRSPASIPAPTRRTGARPTCSRRRAAGVTRRRRAARGRRCSAPPGTRSRRSTCSTARPSSGCGRRRRTPAPSVELRAPGLSPRSVLARPLRTALERRDADVPRRTADGAPRRRRPPAARARVAVAGRHRHAAGGVRGGGRAAALDPRARRRPLRLPAPRARRPDARPRVARAARAPPGTGADGRAGAAARVLRPADRGEGGAAAGAEGDPRGLRRRSRRAARRSHDTGSRRPRAVAAARARAARAAGGGARPALPRTRPRAPPRRADRGGRPRGSSASADSGPGRSASSASRDSAGSTRASSATSVS